MNNEPLVQMIFQTLSEISLCISVLSYWNLVLWTYNVLAYCILNLDATVFLDAPFNMLYFSILHEVLTCKKIFSLLLFEKEVIPVLYITKLMRNKCYLQLKPLQVIVNVPEVIFLDTLSQWDKKKKKLKYQNNSRWIYKTNGAPFSLG